MDDRDFDALARSLAVPSPRRRALKLLFGGAAASLLAATGAKDAAARCGKVGQRCDENTDCCTGAVCSRRTVRTCVCEQGLTNCGGRCRDLNNSRNHCGTCFNDCLSNEVRQSGGCCRPRLTLCGDVCAAGTNCGACCSGFCFSDNT